METNLVLLQSARQVSVNGHKRQCGICAACMLRRQSVHASDLSEVKERMSGRISRHPLLPTGRRKGSIKLLRHFTNTRSPEPFISTIWQLCVRQKPVEPPLSFPRFS